MKRGFSVNGMKSLPPRTAMLLAFGVMSVVNYAFGLVMGWLLMPGDFGLLAFVQTLLTIAGILLNSGFTWSLAARLVDADPAERGPLVRGAAAGNLLLAVVLSGGVLLLFSLGPLRAGLETWPIALLVAATFPALAVLTITRATVQGHERFGMLALLMASEVGFKALAGIALVKLGYGPVGATAGFLIGSLVAALIGMSYLAVRLNLRPWGRLARPALGTAGVMGASLLGSALLLNLDVIGLKLFTQDRAAVGQYQAGIVLANMPYYLMSATLPVLFTQLVRVKEVRRTTAGVWEALRFALAVLFPVEAALALFPGWFLGLLFPHVYLAGAGTLRVLAVANAAVIVVAVLATALQATGNAFVSARTLLSVALVEAVVLRLAVPAWGGMGAARAFLLAALVALIALAVQYRARLAARPDPHTAHLPVAAGQWLLKYLLAGALALGAAFLSRALTGRDLVAVVAAAAVYVPAVLGLGLVSLSGLVKGFAPSHTRPAGEGRPANEGRLAAEERS